MRKTVDHPGEGDPWPPGTVVFGPRHHWRVEASEPVESQVWPFRWRYTMTPLGPHDAEFEALSAHGVPCLLPYRRGEGPEDHFGPAFGPAA